MKKSTPKPLKKSTPIRNAILWISLTSNAFMFTLAYGVYSGQLQRTDAGAQEVALYQNQDYVTALAGR